MKFPIVAAASLLLIAGCRAESPPAAQQAAVSQTSAKAPMPAALTPLPPAPLAFPEAAAEPAAEVCPNADAESRAALNAIFARFQGMPNRLDVEWDHLKPATFDPWRRKVSTLRTWAKSLKDHCIREAYLGWAEYYDDQIDEAIDEATSHAEERRSQAYDARRRREDAEAAAVHIIKPPASVAR